MVGAGVHSALQLIVERYCSCKLGSGGGGGEKVKYDTQGKTPFSIRAC